MASFPARVKSHLWRRCACCLLSRLSQPCFKLLVFNIFLHSMFFGYSIFLLIDSQKSEIPTAQKSRHWVFVQKMLIKKKICTMDASQLEQNRADGSNVYTCRRYTIMRRKKNFGWRKSFVAFLWKGHQEVCSGILFLQYGYKWWQSPWYTNQIQCIFMSYN